MHEGLVRRLAVVPFEADEFYFDCPTMVSGKDKIAPLSRCRRIWNCCDCAPESLRAVRDQVFYDQTYGSGFAVRADPRLVCPASPGADDLRHPRVSSLKPDCERSYDFGQCQVGWSESGNTGEPDLFAHIRSLMFA